MQSVIRGFAGGSNGKESASHAGDWDSIPGWLVALVVKNPFANAGDIREADSTSRWGRSPGEGNGNPIPYSCLENPTDRGAYSPYRQRSGLQSLTKSWTQLSN